MFAKCLKYELRRSALPFGVLYAAILILSGIAAVTGLSAINPTEVLLISALVLGPVAILAYRFYRTMFSKEAALLLSVPLSSVEQAGGTAAICRNLFSDKHDRRRRSSADFPGTNRDRDSRDEARSRRSAFPAYRLLDFLCGSAGGSAFDDLGSLPVPGASDQMVYLILLCRGHSVQSWILFPGKDFR